MLVAVYKSPLIFLPDFFFSLVALHFYDMRDLSFMTSPFSCYLVVKDVWSYVIAKKKPTKIKKFKKTRGEALRFMNY